LHFFFGKGNFGGKKIYFAKQVLRFEISRKRFIIRFFVEMLSIGKETTRKG
jgi:hypothetical protein